MKVGIAESRDQYPGTEDVRHPSVKLIRSESLISREILISGITYRRTQFEQLEQFRTAHKLLLMYIPSYTYRPSIAEAVTRSEHGRSVATVIHVEQISVVVSISAIQIEADGPCSALGIRRFASVGIAIGKRRRAELVFRKSVCLVSVTGGSRTGEIETSHKIEHVHLTQQLTVCDRQVAFISERRSGGVVVRPFLRLAHAVKISMQRRQTGFRRDGSLRHTEFGTRTQVGRSKPFGYEVIRKPEFITPVVIVQPGVPQRIGNGSFLRILRLIQILVYSSGRIVFAIIRIGQSVLGKEHHGVRRFQIIYCQLITELKLPGAVNQVQITRQGPAA